jgi:hypothetical protein
MIKSNSVVKLSAIAALIFGMAVGPLMSVNTTANAQPANCRENWGVYYCDGYVLGKYDCDQKYTYRDKANAYKEAWKDNSYKEQWWKGYNEGWIKSGCGGGQSGGQSGGQNGGQSYGGY